MPTKLMKSQRLPSMFTPRRYQSEWFKSEWFKLRPTLDASSAFLFAVELRSERGPSHRLQTTLPVRVASNCGWEIQVHLETGSKNAKWIEFRNRPGRHIETRMSSWAKFAFCGLVLGSVAWAQAPSEPAASAATSIVSPEGSPTEGSIKHVPAAAPDNSPDVDVNIVADPAGLLPDLPPVPRAKATLIGGTVERMDHVRDQVTVRVFGGGHMNVLFDPRTHVYRGGKETTITDLKVGERIYLDTILDGNTVFARTVRVKTAQALGESQGVVLKYRSDRGELTLRDSISPTPVHVRLNSTTRFLQGDRAVSPSTLSEGSLVAVKFRSEGDGHDLAQEISILALPGTQYTFAGQVMHIDLRTGLLVIHSSTDRKTYEVYLDPSAAPEDNLHAGAEVTVLTNFEGSRYVARNVTINSQSQ